MSKVDISPTLSEAPASHSQTTRKRQTGSGTHALEIPAYRRYLVSFMAVCFGEQSHEVVRAWLAYDLHNSASEAGIVLLVSAIGQGISTPFGGVVADRLDRKRIMMWTQALMFATSFFVGILVIFNVIQLWHLFALGFVMGVAFGLNGPARQSFVFNIVGANYVSNGLAINYGVLSAMRLIAPALAGLIIATVSIGVAFFSSVVAFALAMVTLKHVVSGSPQKRPENRQSLYLSMKEGASYLYRRRQLFWLFITACGGIILGLPLRNSMSAFVSEGLSAGAGTFGTLLSLMGLGALGAIIFFARVSNFKNKGSLLIWSGIVSGLMIVALSQATTLFIGVPILLVIGAAQVFNQMLPNIVIQRNVEDAFRGRLLSIQALSYSLAGGTGLLLGLLIDFAGVRPAFLALGIILFAFTATIGVWRKDIHALG